eukprot:10699337-Lingulodinium_polyedra.AAC.1
MPGVPAPDGRSRPAGRSSHRWRRTTWPSGLSRHLIGSRRQSRFQDVPPTLGGGTPGAPSAVNDAGA